MTSKNHKVLGHLRIMLFAYVMLFQAIAFCDTNKLDTRDAVDASIKKYSQMIRSSPNDSSLYIQRGNAYFKISELDEAIDDFTVAIKIDNGLDDAYYGRGLAYGRRGLVDEGISDLTVYLTRNPNSSLGYTKRGVRYLWKRDLSNAKKDLTRAIALDQNNAEAHDDLGVVYSLLERYDDAIQHFLATIKLDPSYQKAYHNLAMSYYITEKDQWALDVVNDALTLRPNSRDSKMLKAKILEVLGRKEEATELLENAEFLPEGNWSEHIAIKNSVVDSGLTLKGIDGLSHKFSDYIGQGKWTILNIWGPKCPPCAEEMPQLQAFYDDHFEKDATVIGMAIDYPSFGYAKKSEVIKFMDLNGINYPMLLGDSDTVPKFGGGKLIAVPMTLVYAPDGELKMSHVGLVTADLVEQFISQDEKK